MPSGSDRRPLIPTDGLVGYHASLVLRAMYRQDDEAGRAFRRELWVLCDVHRPAIDELLRGWSPTPVELNELARWLQSLEASLDFAGLSAEARAQINAYVASVREYCHSWRLRAPWASPAVVGAHLIYAEFGRKGLGDAAVFGGWAGSTRVAVELDSVALADSDIRVWVDSPLRDVAEGVTHVSGRSLTTREARAVIQQLDVPYRKLQEQSIADGSSRRARYADLDRHALWLAKKLLRRATYREIAAGEAGDVDESTVAKAVRELAGEAALSLR